MVAIHENSKHKYNAKQKIAYNSGIHQRLELMGHGGSKEIFIAFECEQIRTRFWQRCWLWTKMAAKNIFNFVRRCKKAKQAEPN